MSRLGNMLNSSNFSLEADKRLFTQWMSGSIPTDIAIRLFKKNNLIKKDVEITEEEFTSWLKSIGYWKGARKD